MLKVFFMLLELVFVGLIVFGFWLIWPPLAFITAGASGLYIVFNLSKEYLQ